MKDREAGGPRGPYRSRAEADRLAAEYLAGGVSRQQFCAARNLSVKLLERYVTRFRRQRESGGAVADTAAKSRFVAVEVAVPESGAAGLTVTLAGGRRIEVGRRFDEQTLRRLVTALERD